MKPQFNKWPGALVLALSTAWAPHSKAWQDPVPDPAELLRIPAKSFEEAAASFEVEEGFRLELVAGEPEVVDPVAIAFDERERLFVAEMRGYPERREQALGRIRLLEDVDGDGRYEKATVFADGLKWPTGVVCWKGGVFVAASPDIVYLGDRDGDGVADERRVVFSGFGSGQKRLNMQALVNGLQWGPDGRIYGATASNGGLVKVSGGNAKAINLRGSDFSFDPDTLDLRLESGTAQYGLTFDDYGRRYVCSNSRHLIAVMYSWPWNLRGGLPHPLVDIPVDGGSAEVHRISPVEPWRVVRTRWRVQGLVGGPVEGGGRAAGYFTSASGLVVYRGDAFPARMQGDVFVGDVGSNLVHQKRIEHGTDRVQPVARRPFPERRKEFLASTDNWFRPVQCVNGPGGGLYIVDMYRETIEHPWSIPESIKKHLDLYSGTDRGRIWRVVPDDHERAPLRDRGGVATRELIELLASGNGWERDTAMRLILERGENTAAALVADFALRNGLAESAQAQALRLLSRLRPLEPDEWARWREQKGPEVRRQLVRLQTNVDAASLRGWSGEQDIRVRYQGALRMLDRDAEVSVPLLNRFLETSRDDRWIRSAVIAAAKRHGLLPELVRTQGNLDQALSILRSAGLGGEASLRDHWLEQARARLGTGGVSGKQFESAVWLLGQDSRTSSEQLLEWVEGKGSEEALNALLRRPARDWQARVVARWKSVPTAARGVLLPKMEPSFVLDSVEGGKLLAAEVGFQQKRGLRGDRDPSVRERARAVFGEEQSRSREEAARHYRGALTLSGNPGKGTEIFQQRCFVCHRNDGTGAGPDLASLRNKGAPMLLENLIAPDREVAPQYSLWEARLKDGDTIAGVIGVEDARAITFRFADGTSRAVDRAQVARLINLNRSIMPAGLEAGLSLQEMADLLAYVTGAAR